MTSQKASKKEREKEQKDRQLQRCSARSSIALDGLAMQEAEGSDAHEKVVKRRRKLVANGVQVAGVPLDHYDYSLVEGRNCANVMGYVPITLGVAGPVAGN